MTFLEVLNECVHDPKKIIYHDKNNLYKVQNDEIVPINAPKLKIADMLATDWRFA